MPAKRKLINGVMHRRAYRRSDTGKWCKKAFADSNPSMTQARWIKCSPGRPRKQKNE